MTDDITLNKFLRKIDWTQNCISSGILFLGLNVDVYEAVAEILRDIII